MMRVSVLKDIIVVAAIGVGCFLLYLMADNFFSSKDKADARLARAEASAVIEAVEEIKIIENERAIVVADIDKETKDAIETVLAAPAGDRNDATIAAVCGLRVYKHRPECAGM